MNETVLAEEKEQLREEFRNEELEYNEKLAEDEEALRNAVNERIEKYKNETATHQTSKL